MKFICDQCKAKYQIADEKVAGKTVRMKCRKCGHQIEVRAAVTETSVASRQMDASEGARADDGDPTIARPSTVHSTDPPPPRTSASKPAPAKPGTLATSLAAARPPAARPAAPRAPVAARGPAQTDRPGALNAAFQRSVKDGEEAAPQVELKELSAADEWYVAINGVPVGPIRVAEIRRKAATGGVTEDSLCWQEGLEEWRPVRAFPELAAAVREAATTGRSSLLTQAPDAARPSAPPPGPGVSRAGGGMGASPAPPRTTGGPSPRPAPAAPRPASPAAAAASAQPLTGMGAPHTRSNVVPIGSRLATAERLDDALLVPEPAPSPIAAPPADQSARIGAIVTADPFALPPGGASPRTSSILPAPGAAVATSAQAGEIPTKKPPPWIAIAMVVLAAAFGITTAVVIFMRPGERSAPPPPPIVVQMEGPANNAMMGTTPMIGTTPTDSSGELPPSSTSGPAVAHTATAPAGSGAKVAAATTTASTAGPPTGAIDLGLGGTRHEISNDTAATSTAAANGDCYTQGQVLSVINAHQTAVRRTCWDRTSSQRNSASIGVTITIGPGGNVVGVAAGGDDPTVASCVRSEVSHWIFPAGGCTQRTAFSYKFVR